MRLIKIIVLTNQQLLLSEIEEVQSELGEPDCRLVNPFIFKVDKSLEPFLDGYFENNIFYSDDMLVKHDNEYISEDGETYDVENYSK